MKNKERRSRRERVKTLSNADLKKYLRQLSRTNSRTEAKIYEEDEQACSGQQHPWIDGWTFQSLLDLAFAIFEHKYNDDGSITFFLNRKK